MNNKGARYWMFLLFWITALSYAEEPIWQQANEAYHAGESASTVEERTEAFNKALFLYSQLEQRYQPLYGNGKLYLNIGNTYFQLEQYPWAVLYYYRALTLNPRDDTIANNLHIAQRKAGINEVEEKSIFNKLFFFHSSFSLPERLRGLFILGLLLFVLASTYVWQRYAGFKKAIVTVACLWAILLLSVGYTRYFSPIEGVVVKPTSLYRDAGEQYAKVSDLPILAGSKLRVLDTAPEGKWLKVRTLQGEVGYVPALNFRIF